MRVTLQLSALSVFALELKVLLYYNTGGDQCNLLQNSLKPVQDKKNNFRRTGPVVPKIYRSHKTRHQSTII